METAGAWKLEPTRKNPSKNKDYQNTLLVQRWIAGASTICTGERKTIIAKAFTWLRWLRQMAPPVQGGR